MKKLIVLLVLILTYAIPSMADNGVISVQSDFDVTETADRLESILNNKGMTVFSRIDHSEGARSVGIELRDTVLLIFGNPKVGSPLMKCQQVVALDLPQKALIWEDGDDAVFVSYNDPTYIKTRHNLSGCGEVLAKIERALSSFTKAAATK